MTKEKKILISISSLICFLDVFYELFFNIYILQNVTTDITYIFACYLIGVVVAIVLYYPFYKILNGKTATWIYRFSFVMSFALIVISMTINSGFAFALIFINSLKYIKSMCFSIPQEIATIQFVGKQESDGFLAIKVIFNTVVKVTFSLVVASLFTYVDTIVIFILMLVIVVVMFALSFGIKTTGADYVFRPKAYTKDCKQYPHMRYIYLAHGFKRMSEAGVVATLIPIMLFLKLDSEFSIGIYSTIAYVVTILWLPLFVKLNKSKSPVLYSSIIILLVSSVLLVLIPNKVTYVLYYFINQVASATYTNKENADLFSSIKYPVLNQNKEEHTYFYGLYGLVGEVISYGVGIAFYALIPASISIPLIIILFMSAKLVSLILLQKANALSSKIQTIEPEPTDK